MPLSSHCREQGAQRILKKASSSAALPGFVSIVVCFRQSRLAEGFTRNDRTFILATGLFLDLFLGNFGPQTSYLRTSSVKPVTVVARFLLSLCAGGSTLPTLQRRLDSHRAVLTFVNDGSDGIRCLYIGICCIPTATSTAS